MSTLIATFADAEVKVRFKEPFLTEGMNKKGAAVVAPGVYRGFKLIANVTDNLLTVEADSSIDDHVLVYETDDGYSIHVRKTSDFTIDFTGLSISTEYITAVHATYALDVTTVVEIRAYTLAEYNAAPEKDELIILGTATTPGSLPGTIAPSPNRRSSSWLKVAPEVRVGEQVIDNGGFELAALGAITIGADAEPLPGWNTHTGTILGFTWSVVQTAPRTGANELRLALSGGVLQVGGLFHGSMFKVHPGQLVRPSVWVRGVSVTPGPVGGALGIAVSFHDQDLGFLVQTNISDSSLVGTFAYTEITETIEVPSSAVFASIALLFSDNSNNSTGDYFFDDVSLWLGKDNPLIEDDAEQDIGEGSVRAYSVDILNPDDFSTMADFMAEMIQLRSLGLSAGVNELVMRSRDGGVTPFDLLLKNGGLDIERIIKGLGAEYLGSLAERMTPRVSTEVATSDFVLIWEAAGVGGSDLPIRLYVSDSQAMWLTVNARYTGTSPLWDRDVAGLHSSAVYFSRYYFQVHFHLQSDSAPWDTWGQEVINSSFASKFVNFIDSFFRIDLPDHALEVEDGILQVVGASTYSNIAKTVTPLANTLYAISMVKAWGVCDGGNDPLLPANWLDAFNIDVTASNWNVSTSVLEVHFEQSMGSSDYVVVAQESSVIGFSALTSSTNGVANFRLRYFDNTLNPVNMGGHIIGFIVIGRQ